MRMDIKTPKVTVAMGYEYDLYRNNKKDGKINEYSNFYIQVQYKIF